MAVVVYNTDTILPNNPQIPSFGKVNGRVFLLGYHQYDYEYYWSSTDGGATWTAPGTLVSVAWINHASITTPPGSYLFAVTRVGQWQNNGALRVFQINADGTLTQLNLYEGWGTSTTNTDAIGSTDKAHLFNFGGTLWAVVDNVENAPDYGWAVITTWKDNGDGTATQLNRWEVVLNDAVNDVYEMGLGDLGGGKALFASRSATGLIWQVLDNNTGSVEASGTVAGVTPRGGNAITVIGNGNGEGLILYTDNADGLVKGVYYANGAVGSPFLVGDTTGIWQATGDYDPDTNTVYVAMVNYYDRWKLRKATFVWGSTTPTLDYWSDALTYEFDSYSQWEAWLEKDTGQLWVAYQDDNATNYVVEKFTYKTVSSVVTETVADTLSFSEALRGSLGTGLKDSVGMIDIRGESPTQHGTEAVTLTEILELARMVGVGVSDTVGLNTALVGSTAGVLRDYEALTAVAFQVSGAGVSDAITPADTATLGVKMAGREAVALAEALGLPATSRVLSLISLVAGNVGSPAGVMTDATTVSAETITSAYSLLAEAVTLADVVSAVEQILKEVQALADVLGLSAEAKATTTAVVRDLLTALERLKASVAMLTGDVTGLVDALTATQIVGVTTEAVADTISMVDAMTLNALSVELTGILLKTKLWESADTVGMESVGVVAKDTAKLMLKVLDGVGLPDAVSVFPRAVVNEVIPLLDDVISHYLTAIAVLTDVAGLNEVIGGSVAGLSLFDALTITADVATLKWLFAREVLRLYSRITAMITANSIIKALVKRRSIINKIVRK